MREGVDISEQQNYGLVQIRTKDLVAILEPIENKLEQLESVSIQRLPFTFDVTYWFLDGTFEQKIIPVYGYDLDADLAEEVPTEK